MKRYLPAIAIFVVAMAAMWYFMLRPTEVERLRAACGAEMEKGGVPGGTLDAAYPSCDKLRQLQGR
jgi:hypothetical protein